MLPGLHCGLIALTSLAGTWNPANKSANVTLSNNNLTMTGTSSSLFAWAKSTNSLASGAAYIEFLVGSGSGLSISVGNSGASFADGNISNPNATTYVTNGDIYQTGGFVLSAATFGAGDTIGLWINRTAGWAQFYKNNIAQGGQYNISTGAQFLIGSSFQHPVTLNKTPTYALPSGATYWGN